MFRKEKGRPLALDFPNATTSKQSKKFVNQMRSLKVRSPLPSPLVRH